MNLSHNLKFYRKRLKMNQYQFADFLGTTQPTISRLERGGIGQPRMIELFAEKLGITPAALVYGKIENSSTGKIKELPEVPTSVKKIPLVTWKTLNSIGTSKISIAQWMKEQGDKMEFESVEFTADEKIGTYIALRAEHWPPMICPTPHPKTIFKDDILVIDLDKEPENEDIVLVTIGAEWYIRQIFTDGVKIFLEALNPQYPPLDATNAKIEGVIIKIQRLLG